MRIVVTGGCGFIGSAVVRRLIQQTDHEVMNLDKMTYAATHESVAQASSDNRYQFCELDICDGSAVGALFESYRPEAVIHLAAESHVDRSIDGPEAFVQTNVLGTMHLLQAARALLESSVVARDEFRFLHVSTDEVFGALGPHDEPFNESTRYSPRSPYSASKASADHLVRSWGETFDIPTLITNCSNNYGPYQFPEKLIPLVILKALEQQPIPVYGTGENVRDWLFVEDHARAINTVLDFGRPGETYLIGGNAEKTNLEVVTALCDLVDEQLGLPEFGPRRQLIEFVDDRPGHDLRYAVNFEKTSRELDWHPEVDFEQGLSKTVEWYLENSAWWTAIASGTYAGTRLGLP